MYRNFAIAKIGILRILKNMKLESLRKDMYYVYMLRCEDNTIYTGITTDVKKRMKEHFSKDKNCAKYTKRHSAKKLEIVWQTEDRVLASKLEYRIKQLTKSDKEDLIKNNALKELLSEKIEIDKYERIDKNMFY